MSLLEVKNLLAYFDTRRGIVKAVDGSFTLKREILGIVGESGLVSQTAMSILRLLNKPIYS